MRILVLAALALALCPPAGRPARRTRDRPSRRRPRSRSTTRSTLARRNNPVYPRSRRTTAAPPTPPSAARGALLPSADAIFGTPLPAGRPAGVQRTVVQQQLRDAVQSSYGLNLNYRVNSATFVNPKAAVANRDAVDADITGAAEQLRAARHAAVPQRAAGAGARRAAGHAREHGRRRSSTSRKAKVAVGSGTVARHPPRRSGARPGAGRAAHGAEQRRGREAAPLPADGRRAAGRTWRSRRTSRSYPPTFSLDSLLDLARRPESGHRRAPLARARRDAEREGRARRRTRRRCSLSTGWGGNSYQYTDADYLVNQARAGVLGQHVSLLPAGLHPHARRPAVRPNCAARVPVHRRAGAGDPRANSQFPFKFQRSPLALSAPALDPDLRQLQPRGARAARRRSTARRRDVQREGEGSRADGRRHAGVPHAEDGRRRRSRSRSRTRTKAQEELAFAEERYKVGASHLPRRHHVARHVRAGADRPRQCRLRLPQGLRRARERGRASPPLIPPRDSDHEQAREVVRGRRGAPRHRRDRRADRREGQATRPSRCAPSRCRRAISSPRSRRAARCGRSTKVDLSSDITGKIVQLAVKEGQMVTKGQFLLQIDPQQAEAAVQRVRGGARVEPRADGAGARPTCIQAQKSYERTAAIKKTNPQLISDEQLEQLRTAVDVNKALYEAARHAVDQSTAGAARRAQLARQDDDLRADVRPRDAPRTSRTARRRSWAR